jgi:hypothetical protein
MMYSSVEIYLKADYSEWNIILHYHGAAIQYLGKFGDGARYQDRLIFNSSRNAIRKAKQLFGKNILVYLDDFSESYRGYVCGTK